MTYKLLELGHDTQSELVGDGRLVVDDWTSRRRVASWSLCTPLRGYEATQLKSWVELLRYKPGLRALYIRPIQPDVGASKAGGTLGLLGSTELGGDKVLTSLTASAIAAMLRCWALAHKSWETRQAILYRRWRRQLLPAPMSRCLPLVLDW